jgi:hypothetical protein
MYCQYSAAGEVQYARLVAEWECYATSDISLSFESEGFFIERYYLFKTILTSVEGLKTFKEIRDVMTPDTGSL